MVAHMPPARRFTGTVGVVLVADVRATAACHAFAGEEPVLETHGAFIGVAVKILLAVQPDLVACLASVNGVGAVHKELLSSYRNPGYDILYC